MYIYEFILDEKIILIECNNFSTSLEIINQYFYKNLILLKSIYKNIEHYSFINENFIKYFKKKKHCLDNKSILIYEIK